jgi:phosphoribosylformylglycinamidine cyclo-ligase
VFRDARWELDRQVDEFGQTLGEELLTPTRVYSADLLDLVREDGVEVHALSHVTGGGLAANLARVLPSHLFARLDRATWTPAPVFQTVGSLGKVPRADLERTLNMGVGFVAVLPAEQADAATRALEARGIPAWVMGEVTPLEDAVVDGHHEVVRGAKGVAGGAVQLVGDHPLA